MRHEEGHDVGRTGEPLAPDPGGLERVVRVFLSDRQRADETQLVRSRVLQVLQSMRDVARAADLESGAPDALDHVRDGIALPAPGRTFNRA